MDAAAASSSHNAPVARTLPLRPMRALCAGACVVLLAGMALPGCRPAYERPLTVADAIAIANAAQQVDTEMRAEVPAEVSEPRKHARSHVLLGIDFTKPLKLPECARYYDRFDRPPTTCAYLSNRDHKPFKIEFKDGAVPDFLKWNNASIATDGRGRPQMVRFDIGNDPGLEGRAVDAMLEKFGPPTSVENSTGNTKVGTWRHQDYVIQLFFDPNGATVQMETKKFHDEPTASAGTGGAKL